MLLMLVVSLELAVTKSWGLFQLSSYTGFFFCYDVLF